MSSEQRNPAPPQAEPAPAEERPHGDPVAEAGAAEAASAPAEAASRGADGVDAPPVDPLATAEAKAQEYLELAQRKQAEFENFRRRMNLQVALAEDRGVGRLARELLPALDHLERALEAAEQHVGADDEWVKGVRLVQEEVLAALSRVGIQPFAPFGEPFDPKEHEAVAQAPAGDLEAGMVAQVYQQGYRLNGAVLRPARVVVST